MPDIWSDPNLMAMILGMGAQAIMGPEQESWQAGFGRMAQQLGTSFKMADIYAAEQAREQDFWNRILGLLGGEAAPEGGVAPTAFGGVAPMAPERRSEFGEAFAAGRRPPFTPVTGFPSPARRIMGGF